MKATTEILKKAGEEAGEVWSFIRAIGVGCPKEQFMVFIEIIPSEIRDVVSKSLHQGAEGRRPADNACGFKSLNDAIIVAQNIGFRLLGNVKAENLLFVFGQTVQSLQSALREFADQHFISYPATDCYAPVRGEERACDDKRQGDPLAVVLCKLVNAESLEPFAGTKQKKGSNDTERYEVTWGQLQSLQQRLGIITTHIVGVDSKPISPSSGNPKPENHNL